MRLHAASLLESEFPLVPNSNGPGCLFLAQFTVVLIPRRIRCLEQGKELGDFEVFTGDDASICQDGHTTHAPSSQSCQLDHFSQRLSGVDDVVYDEDMFARDEKHLRWVKSKSSIQTPQADGGNHSPRKDSFAFGKPVAYPGGKWAAITRAHNHFRSDPPLDSFQSHMPSYLPHQDGVGENSVWVQMYFGVSVAQSTRVFEVTFLEKPKLGHSF